MDKIMIQRENFLYEWCETGDWIRCGEIKSGIMGDYIIWFY